tara:strand:+ start:485 stop:1039 length:555 start_codon:yes stop_codon:yes gene_type:complete
MRKPTLRIAFWLSSLAIVAAIFIVTNQTTEFLIAFIEATVDQEDAPNEVASVAALMPAAAVAAILAFLSHLNVSHRTMVRRAGCAGLVANHLLTFFYLDPLAPQAFTAWWLILGLLSTAFIYSTDWLSAHQSAKVVEREVAAALAQDRAQAESQKLTWKFSLLALLVIPFRLLTPKGDSAVGGQ